MKHKLSFVASLWWVLLCAIAGLFLLLLPEKQTRPSDVENRMLAGFPQLSAASVASGEFMSGFESYLSDGFFARDDVIDLSEALMDRFSTLTSDERIAVEQEDMERRLEAEAALKAAVAAEAADTGAEEPAQEEPLPGAEAPAADSGEPEAGAEVPDIPEAALDMPEAFAGAETDEDLDAGDGGELPAAGATLMDEREDESEDTIVSGDKIPLDAEHSYLWYDLANGSRVINYTYDNRDIRTYSETLKLMQNYLPKDGVICFTQVPLSSMARRWTSQRKSYTGWGSSVETVLEKCLEGTERIYVFSTYDILRPYMETSGAMFYHSDHHWSAEGAYVVFAEMMKRQNLPVIPYDEYTYKSMRGRGHTDVFNVLYPLLPGHSYVIRHVDEATEIDLMNYDSPTYLAFMNSTQLPWRRIVTGANTGRKALVICDSFGNAFTPYLLPYYDEVHMTDFRYNYYSKRDVGGSIGFMISYYKIDDVYIITSTANGLRKDNSIKYLRQFLKG